MPAPTIEETLAPWIASCPATDHPDCRYAEVVIKIHQGRITAYHITVKHLIGASPPTEADDSDHAHGAVREINP